MVSRIGRFLGLLEVRQGNGINFQKTNCNGLVFIAPGENIMRLSANDITCLTAFIDKPVKETRRPFVIAVLCSLTIVRKIHEVRGALGALRHFHDDVQCPMSMCQQRAVRSRLDGGGVIIRCTQLKSNKQDVKAKQCAGTSTSEERKTMTNVVQQLSFKPRTTREKKPTIQNRKRNCISDV